ncbi:MAG: zinc-ribbon domain-containing protein [Nitrososphaerota archaeon]|nr:zinc-ribbon domain-containing protein [Nitrososphaerota archaeon]
MPYCPSCGREVQPDFLACPNCGQGLSSVQISQAPTSPPSQYPPHVPTAPPKGHRKRNVAISVLAVFLLLFVVPAVYYALSPSPDVYITDVVYTYNCSNCQSTQWNYSAPIKSYANAGSTLTETSPFSWPSTQACSVTLNDFHATTPGFLFSVTPLPVTISPGSSASLTFTISMPPQAYNGPLDVSVTLTSGC